MSKAPSPLLGYNNNVRHKSRVFHIQTEDSGIKHPHVITHLFMDGGRILKSVKKSYAEHLGTEGLEVVVRQMMKEQHKAMFIALRGGQFDHLVDAAVDGVPSSLRTAAAPKVASDPPASRPSPPPASRPSPPPVLPLVAPTAPTPIAGAEADRTRAAAVARITIPDDVPPPSSGRARPALNDESRRKATVVADDTQPQSNGPATTPAAAAAPLSGPELREHPPSETETIPAAPPSGLELPTELTLDIDALEPSLNTVRDPYWMPELEARSDVGPQEPIAKPAAVAENATPAAEALRELSPALFKKKADTFRFRHLPGKETRATAALLSTSVPKSFVESAALRSAAAKGESTSSSGASAPRALDKDKPGGAAAPPPPARSPAPPGSSPLEGRYAPARPAAIFGHARPQQGSSIFGEDLISDKSLDEVILSYLAEDLETDKK